MRIPVRHTSTMPSMDFMKFQCSIGSIAIYAKVANEVELYYQAKDIHDKMAQQFNTANAPKKKGFWGEFMDNLCLNMDTHSFTPAYNLEDEPFYSVVYEQAQRLSSSELRKKLNDAIVLHNKLFG